jgi:hypothetical protein
MKRTIELRVVAACLGFLAMSGIARATTVGMDTDPMGDRGDATVRFAYWDSFTQTQVNPPGGTTYTFNGVADGTSTLTNLSLAQNTAHALGVQGSGLLNGGDVYYSSTFAQSWTLGATAAIDVKAISFQIKTANVNVSVINQLFVPTLVGVGPGTFHVGQLSSDSVVGFPAYVIEYRWSGLDIPAGTPLDFQFAMAGGPSGNFTRKPVDQVSLDVSSVPEPGSAALLAMGAAVALCGLRRYRRGV